MASLNTNDGSSGRAAAEGDSPGVVAARQWAGDIACAAGAGWRVDIRKQPPYGWCLFDPEDEVRCSGSLDRLEQWVKQHGGDCGTDTV